MSVLSGIWAIGEKEQTHSRNSLFGREEGGKKGRKANSPRRCCRTRTDLLHLSICRYSNSVEEK